MKVSLIQMDMEFGNPEKNYIHAEGLIRKAAENNPDVIVLPETWNTGFFPREDIDLLADNDGNRTKSICKKLALEYGVNIVAGSVTTKKSDGIFNTAYVFNRKGDVIAEYDKTHLFSPTGEDKFYKKGNSAVTFELDGIKCGIIICYDIRFLELVRTLALEDIKVLFVPAQWPDVRINHWKILNQARAIENQIFNINVNSCGMAGKTQYGGNSSAIDPWGNVLEIADDKEAIFNVELDMSIIDGIRNSINVYSDRRIELYKVNR